MRVLMVSRSRMITCVRSQHAAVDHLSFHGFILVKSGIQLRSFCEHTYFSMRSYDGEQKRSSRPSAPALGIHGGERIGWVREARCWPALFGYVNLQTYAARLFQKGLYNTHCNINSIWQPGFSSPDFRKRGVPLSLQNHHKSLTNAQAPKFLLWISSRL